MVSVFIFQSLLSLLPFLVKPFFFSYYFFSSDLQRAPFHTAASLLLRFVADLSLSLPLNHLLKTSLLTFSSLSLKKKTKKNARHRFHILLESRDWKDFCIFRVV